MPSGLPIDAHIPEIVAGLRGHGVALVSAAPGAGKTTRVPAALVDAGVTGAVVVLEPRRVAARAAARRVAAERGSVVGGEVGFQVRHERRLSSATRIRFVTEGVLVRQLVADPFLDGVGAVVLDEFHERHMEGDLALAMLQEIRQTVRGDLLLLVMSATLDSGALRGFFAGSCAMFDVPGRLHPVTTDYLGKPAPRELARGVAGAVGRALEQSEGDVLVFLPGVGEIQATQRVLADRLGAGVEVLPLHGRLDPAAQDRALLPGHGRRVVLATNLAESSVTLPGVTAVVDSGLVRRLRHDGRRGLDVLRTETISVASAVQRRGRAGRTAPGLCYRLWAPADERAMPAREPPEVARVDVSGAVLAVRAFTAAPAAKFGWFEAPAAGALAAAEALLRQLGAVESGGERLCGVGWSMLALPLHPRLARTMVEAEQRGCSAEAAAVAALLAERDVWRGPPEHRPFDLFELLGLLDAVAPSGRVDRDRCRAHGLDTGAVHGYVRARRQIAGRARAVPGGGSAAALGCALLAGFPDRVARRVAEGRPEAVMVGGRGLLLPAAAVGSVGELFLAVQASESAARSATRSRVELTADVQRRWLEDVWPEALRESHDAELDGGRVVAVRRVRFHDLVLEESRGGAPDPEAVAALLGGLIEADVWRYLDDRAPVDAVLARVGWLGGVRPELRLPELAEAAVVRAARSAIAGANSVERLPARHLVELLLGELGAEQRAALEREAPVRVTLPSGRQVRVDYAATAGPTVAAPLQELFGQVRTPTVAAGRVPLVLELLLPNQRPVQVTRDLASFWTQVYPSVQREMRRRYPRHPWPEDPMAARPHRGPLPRRRS